MVGKFVASDRRAAAARRVRPDGGHDCGKPRADRRVLVHPPGARRVARAARSDTHALVVGAALLSITVNQPLQAWLQRLLARYAPGIPEAFTEVDDFDFGAITDHVILVGYGRVGTTITEALDRAGILHIVVEEQPRVVAGLRLRGEHAISGDATRAEVLQRAGVAGARLIVVTAPEPIRARRIVEVALEENPHIAVAVRTHSATEQAFFEQVLHTPGVHGRAVYAEREVALSLAHYTLVAVGRSDDERTR
jgi:CPA2 family monovalent cation:H+ antiporter-2